MPTLTFSAPWLGTNARNMALPFGLRLILIRPDLKYPAATWAQERYEASQKDSPREWLRYIRSADERRLVEMMGREIEVQVAVDLYGADEGEKRRFEARGLAKYPDFTGIYTARMIESFMIGLTHTAVDWIDQHKSEIRKRK